MYFISLFHRAFGGFADHFREQADALLNSLDPGKQKMLQGELSNSSSNNSLNNAGNAPQKSGHMSKGKDRTRSMSTERTVSKDLYGYVQLKLMLKISL